MSYLTNSQDARRSFQPNWRFRQSTDPPQAEASESRNPEFSKITGCPAIRKTDQRPSSESLTAVEVRIQQMREQKEKRSQLKRSKVEGQGQRRRVARGIDSLEGAKDCPDWKTRPR
jgi:hypothetical protein